MKRILIVALALIVTLSPLAAQGITVGPKASVGTSSLRGDDWNPVDPVKNALNLSFSGGLTAVIEMSPLLGVQVDLLYARFGYKIDDGTDWVSYNWNAINLPVYARFTFALGGLDVYALAGVDLNLLFGDVKGKDSTGASISISLADYFDNAFWFGIAAGAGVSLPMGSGAVDVGIRYRTHLNQFAEDTDIFSQSILLDFAYRFAL